MVHCKLHYTKWDPEVRENRSKGKRISRWGISNHPRSIKDPSLHNATLSWLTFGLNISEQVSAFGLHKIHDEMFGDAVILDKDCWYGYFPHDDPVHVSMCAPLNGSR